MKEIWQCPTVLLPVSVDGRGSELVVLRPVHSERAMTARPAWPGADCVAEVTRAIMEFDEVGAVAIDATTKPPGTIEWE
jgi:GMP synthase PP-ATPase subunit